MPKELILSGNVQGVFCRHYCSEIARRLGVNGSASNLADGTVRVILDCNEDKVNQFVKALRENTFNVRFYGHISSVKVNDYIGIIRGDYIF